MDESEGETWKDVRGGLEGRVKGNSIGRRQMIVSINDQRLPVCVHPCILPPPVLSCPGGGEESRSATIDAWSFWVYGVRLTLLRVGPETHTPFCLLVLFVSKVRSKNTACCRLVRPGVRDARVR